MFWCCSSHETKAKKQGKKEQQQKTRRRSERNQGERKGDTEKWPEITLFQGGKQCFCKKTKKQKIRRVERQLPKNTNCRAALPPIPRRMCTKEKNTKTRRGGCEEDHLKSAKTGSNKKKLKRHKNPPNRSRKAICGDDPNSNRRRDTPAPLRVKFARAPEKREKCPFQNELASAAPRAFLHYKPNFVKNSNFKKYKIVTCEKNYSQKRCKIEHFHNVRRGRRGR